MNPNQKFLYDALTANKFDVGDEATFSKNIVTPEGAKWAYDQLKDKVDLGEYNAYYSAINPGPIRPQEPNYALDPSIPMGGTPKAPAKEESEPVVLGQFPEMDLQTPNLEAGLTPKSVLGVQGKDAGSNDYARIAQETQRKSPRVMTELSINIERDRIAPIKSDLYMKAAKVKDLEGNEVIKDPVAAYDYENYAQAQKILNDAEKIIKAPKKGQWGFWKGAGETASDKDFWSLGLTELSRNINVKRIIDKLDKGVKVEELRDSDRSILDALAVQTQAELSRRYDTAASYKGGKGTVAMLGFMVELGLTGGVGKLAVKGGEKALISYIAKKIASKTGQRLAGLGAKSLTRTAAAGIGASFAPSTFVKTVQNQAGTQVGAMNEDGLVKYAGAQDIKEGFEGYKSALTDTAIEFVTEMSGGSLGVLGKVLKEIPGLSTALQAFSKSSVGKIAYLFGANPYLKKAGLHGFLGEYNEEFDGAVLRQLFMGEDMKDSFLNWDAQATLLFTLAPMGGFSAGVNGLSSVRFSHNLDKSERRFTDLLTKDGEYSAKDIADLKTALLAVTPQEAGQQLAILSTVNGQFDESLYQAGLSYLVDATKYNGFTQGLKSRIDEFKAAAEAKALEASNADTGQVQRVQLSTGGEVNLTGGQLVLTEDGKIDFEKSDRALYYIDQEGNKQIVHINQVEKLLSSAPLDQVIADATAGIEAAEIGKANYEAGQAVVLLDANGQPQVGETGQPVATTITNVDDSGVTFATAEGVETKASFEEADKMLAPATDILPDLTGQSFEANGLRLEVQGMNTDGTYSVDIYDGDAFVNNTALPLEAIQQAKQAQDLTKSGKTETVNPAPNLSMDEEAENNDGAFAPVIAADYLFTGGSGVMLSTEYLLTALAGAFTKATSQIQKIRANYLAEIDAANLGNIKDFVNSDLYKKIMSEIETAIIQSYGNNSDIQSIFNRILQHPTGLPARIGNEISIQLDEINRQESTSEIPADKNGKVDFNSISDPAVYAEALKSEFGEDEAATVANEYYEYAKDEQAKAEKIKDPIERRRAIKAAAGKVSLFEQVKQALMPVENIEDIAADAETPATDTTEKKKDVSLLTPAEALREFNQATGSRRTELAIYLVDHVDKALGGDRATVIRGDVARYISAIEAWGGKLTAEELPRYEASMGVNIEGRVFINLDNIKNSGALIETWAHEHGHSIVKGEFTPRDLDAVFRASNKGLLIQITNDQYTKSSDTELIGEAICHGIEFYMQFGAKELAEGAINEINPLLEGQDALNEAIFKVLRTLTNNNNHGQNWNDNQRGAHASGADRSAGTNDAGNVEQGTGTGERGTQSSDTRPGSRSDQKEPKLSNGQRINYQGSEYVVNGVNRDVETGDITYDLETEQGDVAFEDIPEADLVGTQNSASAVGPRQKEMQADTDGTGASDQTDAAGATSETTTDTEIAALEAERDRMLSEAAALREQAKATPGKEKYVLYGKEEALKSKAVAIDKKIEALRATPVDRAVEAQQPNTDPTDAQKEAGNYKKAHVTVQGMDITIENPKGSTRKGVDEDGKAWENTMQHHYGYFKRTEGKDGDHVDVFIGPNPESPRVFVVDQVFVGGDRSGQFDESKVMVGFNTAEEAKAAYMSNYAPDWNGLSNITEVDVEAFKKWLYDGKRQRKPFAEYVEFEGQIDETIPTQEEEAAEMEAYNKRLEAETREKYGIIPHKGIETPITKLKKVSDTYYLAGERTLDGVKVSGFMPLEGAKSVKLDVPGDFFAHKTSTGYSVSEGVTGVTVGNGKSAKEAVADANTRINANGIEKLKAAISNQIKTTGVSPRYQIDAPGKSKEDTDGINPARLKDHAELRAMRESTYPEFNNTPTLINLDAFVDRVKKLDEKSKEDEYWYEKGFRYMVTISFPHSLGEMGNSDAKFLREKPTLKDIEAYVLDNLKTTLEISKDSGSARDERLVNRIQEALDFVKAGDIQVKEAAPVDFTFMSNSPMNKARALERLEKLIRDRENRVIPIYQWLEEMPRGLEVGMAKVQSRNDKGYTEKRTVGDHIVDTKAEQDYYNYLEEGGLPYSEHLKAEKVKADKQAEIDKIEREKKREADKIKEAERDARVKAAELRGLKELLTVDVEELIARGNAPLERDLKSEQKRRDSPGKEQQIAYLNRMIEQHDRVTRQEAKNAKELFEIGPDGNPRQKYVYQPGDAVKVVAWNASNPVETKIVQVKDPVASDNFPRYEVEPREGIHNVHIGYTYLRPVETPTDPKGGKAKEYINGGSEARKQELIDRIKNKLDNGTQAMFKTTPGAAIYDPELFRDGVELAGYFIQDGYTTFPDYATAMVDTFGDAIIPYLRGFYKGIYAMPGMAEAFPGRTPDAEVDNYDVYKKIAEKENTNSKKDVSLDDQKFIKDHIIIAKPGLTPTQNESNTDRSGQSGTVEAGRKSTETPSAVVSGSGTSAEIPGAQSELGAGLGSNRDEERSGQRSGTGADARTTEPGSDANNTAGGNNVGRSDRASVQQNAGTGSLNSRNYVIPRGTDVAPKGDITKIRANIAAIKLAKKLNESGQTATPEQQAVLVKYTGWGGLSSVFKESDPNYKALKDVLTNDEYDSARASTTTSFYTPPAITSAVWDMISKLGFKGGITLEPSAGIGHFFGLMPQEMAAKSTLRGVELDRVSGLILKALYPDARINIGGFEEQRIANNSVDLVVTNVPFGDFKVHDSVEKDISAKFNIHDYFIAKSVRKLKPGGIGVFITTSSTMDKSNALRSWLINEGNADVIDVMRLNSDTFKQAAGTEATADIIIIRKRDAKGKSPFAKNVQDVVTLREGTYREAKKTSWGALIGYEEKTTQMRINKYFVDNPDKMAGEMKFGFEGGNEMRPTEQRLAPVAKIKQDQVIAQFIEDLPADLASETKEVPWSTPVSSDGTKEGGLTVIDGKIYQIAYGNAVPVTLNEKKVSGYPKAEVVQNYIRIKAAISSLLEAENNDAADIDARRKELNAAYDVFVKRYGPMHKNTKVTFLREDVDYPAISAIEDVTEKQDPITGKKDVTITKSDIFSKRVISKQQELKAENIEDGIRVSLYKSGRVDTALIADLLGKEEADVVAEILEKRAGFMNPAKGIIEDRDTYLSGNVREKLEAAEIANEHGEYAANIEELSKVVPADIPMHLIKVSLGSTWIPTAAYNKFFNETFGVEANIQKTSSDKYIANFRGQGNATDAGQGLPGEVNGSEIALDAMNNTSTIVYRTEWVPGEGRKRVKDQQATAQAATKQTALNEAFEAWCKSASNTFAEEMEQTYNKVFNAVVERKTDVSAFDTFPGASNTKIPRAHQKEGVLRSLEQATLLAHEVGTGKTITLISAAMEMRRLGLAKKPCIVVQRSTYEQFVKEIKSLYPSAKVLVPSAKDLTAAQREQLFAKIAYNDWDIVVLYHGYLDSIPDDPDRVNNYIDERIQEKIELMQEVADSGAENSKRMVSNIKKEIKGLEKKKSVKQEEKTKSKAEARAKKLMDRRTDNAMTFEQLGIDALLVDEAHAYKKLGFVTSLQGIKGIDTGASQRAQSLRLKTSYILENNNGKNVVFATGTPISNTMAEMWTFLRYLLPKEELSRLQMRTFDAFVNNFGDIVEGQEFSTSGKYKITNRFSSYANIPELLRPWKQIAHVVLTEEVGALKEGVGTPRVEGGKPADLLLKQTPTLKGVMKGIKNTLTEFENMTGKEKKENSHIPLVMFGLAKRAAIDVRLVNPSLPDEADSKTNISVKEIIADLKKTASYNGTVAVFCDAYQSTDKKFNVFADMKAKLVAAGIPDTQIAIVNEYNTDEKKAALWDKVNRGEVRVVFGTTEKLGVGVNIQERLHMLVHLDAPIRPSDYQQRNGRIMRQGNLHLDMGETIRILRVGVEQTLDVTGYQRLEIKKKFIDQIMKGDTTVRTIEEEEAEGSDQNNFSQMMASLSGSQAALALSLEQNKLRKLENARDYHAQNQIYMANQVRHNENVIRTTGDIISQLEEERAAVEALFPAKRIESVTYGNTTASTDDEIANLLNKTINKAIDKEVEILRADNLRSISEMKTKLSINGVPFDIEIQLRKELDATTGKYTVRKQVSYRCQKMEDMEGLAGARVENVLNVVDRFISLKEFDDKISKRRIAVDKAVRDNEVFKPQIGKEFPKEAELEASQRKVLELEAQMKTELEAIEAEEAKDNVDAIDISGAVVEDSDISGAVEEGEDTDSGVRFRMPATIEVDGITRPTTNSNGAPIHSTEEGVRNFWNWFGDSEVVDKEGKPLVVYHGTGADFDKFNSKTFPTAGYFSKTPDIANSVAHAKTEYYNENGSVYPVYLLFENPLDLNNINGKTKYTVDELSNIFPIKLNENVKSELLRIYKNPNPLWSYLADRNLIEYIKSNGYDGILYKEGEVDNELNEYLEVPVNNTESLIAFLPTQIKSATGNIGEFDPDNGDIRFRMVTIPTKPNIQDFGGDQKAYENALKDYERKTRENAIFAKDKLFEPLERLIDTEYEVKQNEEKETIPISSAIDTYDIPPTGDVWEENYRIYTPARVIYNEDNIARAIYAEGADLLNPLKNRRHLLNFDRIEGVPQINIPNARRFRDEFNFHIERYADKLARAKRLSTPAAQRYINEVIEEAAYAKEFYERYAAGEDVWRTQRGPAFRMVTIPTKPDFKDFNGDLGAYANALKDFHQKNTELVPEMVDAVHEAMNRDMDEFLRKRQDADRPVRQLQLFVAENGGTVTDAQDVYNDKNRSVGRSTFKAQEFERVQMKALTDAYRAILKGGNLKAVHEVPVSNDTTEDMRKIGAYLQAKDIQEAIELGLVDRGELGFLQDVGITHEEYVAEFEANVPAKLIDALHEAVKDATLFGLEQELEGGLMTVDEFNEFAAREYYVPQRGWEERDSKQGETHYLRQGHVYGDPYNAVLVKAKGRESLASDPLKYIQSMGHSAILTAEKNKYKQKALSLVKTNISIGRASGAFNFKRVWYVNSNIKDADGNLLYDEVFERPDQALFEQDTMTRARIKELRTMLRGVRLEAKRVDPLDPEYGATMAELGRLEKEILFEIEEATESINIRTKVNDAYKRQRTNAESAQHEVVVYNNGERLVVYFSDERVANAINNQSEDFTLPKFLQTFGKATRWYSSMMTQYNPAFAAWNFMRDIQLANIALFAEQGAKFAATFNKNILDPKLSASIWRRILGKESNKIDDVVLEEFFKDGAATGFTYLKDLDQIQKNLRKEIEPTILEATLGSQFMLLNGKALGKAFAALTEYSELVTRYAAYKTARELGMSRERAATIAKDVTVNFNRKGSDTRIFSSMFAFFNASVQGVHRAGKLGKYGKVFGSVTALLAIGGFLNTLFNPNDPDDEKNWSEFDRMQNVIIGGVKLPVTHFFRGFWAFGVQAALAYRGEKSIANAIFDAGKNMTNELMPANINPVNAFKWDKEANAPVYEGVRDFVPSIVAPVFDIAENKSYTGATVYREAFTDADKTPQAFLGKRDVSPLAQGISNWLLEIGGGDKNIKDLYKADGGKVAAVFDVNPSAMEYLATSYTGGVGKFVMDSYKAISNAVETGEVDVTKLPVVNRAVKPYNEDKVFFGKYYSLLNKIDAYENSVSKREKSFVQDGQAYRPAIADFMTLLASPRGRVVVKAKALKKQVEALQDLSTQMRVNGKTAEADKYSKQLTSKVKEVDELLKEWDTIKD